VKTVRRQNKEWWPVRRGTAANKNKYKGLEGEIQREGRRPICYPN